MVSAIIPTYNRRELVVHAVGTVLAQTMPVAEIIVVDDGSTDGTEAALREAFGDRIVYVRQANAGVSAARNRGLALARGRYLALLDSDDEWLPEKTARQVEWLEAHPDFGMVLCDVARTDADRRPVDRLERRRLTPEDGWVLKWALLEPALAPVSALFRREVFERTGGFDESLRTAEDLDFHLRVARDWKIGVVDAVLATAMRGHDGLSALAQTYEDYATVIERAAAAAGDRVSAQDRGRALAAAYLRSARGTLYAGRWREALRYARRAWRATDDRALRRQTLALLPLAARRQLARLLGRTR